MADASTPIMFAIVTTNRQAIAGGMAPIFYEDTIPARNEVAKWLELITNCIVHDLHDGSLALTVNQTSQASSKASEG